VHVKDYREDPDEETASPDALYDAVAGWARARHDVADAHVADHLAAHVNACLNGETDLVWRRDVVERNETMGDCDIVVNGTRGILVVRQFTPGRARRFDARLAAHAERYRSLVVYLHDVPSRYRDLWRLRRHRNLADQHDLESLEFVVRPARPSVVDRVVNTHVRRLAHATAVVATLLGVAFGAMALSALAGLPIEYASALSLPTTPTALESVTVPAGIAALIVAWLALVVAHGHAR
jgi:hypothetical protein